MQRDWSATGGASVVDGVVEVEESAITLDRPNIAESIETVPVTADLATELPADEESHRTLFAGWRIEG